MENTTKKRSFRELKKLMGKEEYDAFDKAYAKEYANSSNEFARSYFVNKYNVSEGCHYKLLYDAIVNNLVSEEEVDLMEAKAVGNQKSKSGGTGITSYFNYGKLRRKRYKNIASQFSSKEIEELVDVVIKNPKVSLQLIAEIRGITTTTLQFVLRRAIVECHIGDNKMWELYERSIKFSKNPEKTKLAFDKMIEERNSKIRELLSS